MLIMLMMMMLLLTTNQPPAVHGREETSCAASALWPERLSGNSFTIIINYFFLMIGMVEVMIEILTMLKTCEKPTNGKKCSIPGAESLQQLCRGEAGLSSPESIIIDHHHHSSSSSSSSFLIIIITHHHCYNNFIINLHHRDLHDLTITRAATLAA